MLWSVFFKRQNEEASQVLLIAQQTVVNEGWREGGRRERNSINWVEISSECQRKEKWEIKFSLCSLIKRGKEKLNSRGCFLWREIYGKTNIRKQELFKSYEFKLYSLVQIQCLSFLPLVLYSIYFTIFIFICEGCFLKKTSNLFFYFKKRPIF